MANIGMLICFCLVELVSFILVFVWTIVTTFVVIDGRGQRMYLYLVEEG